MQHTTLTLVNKLGLHARAAMQLVNLASRYQSQIIVVHQGRDIDCKDILQIMSLGASCGAQLAFKIDGPDEIQAKDAITQLVNNRFGENE